LAGRRRTCSDGAYNKEERDMMMMMTMALLSTGTIKKLTINL